MCGYLKEVGLNLVTSSDWVTEIFQNFIYAGCEVWRRGRDNTLSYPGIVLAGYCAACCDVILCVVVV